jgi:hypothetical protein
MSGVISSADLHPAGALAREATMRALKARIPAEELEKFLAALSSNDVPAAIGATVSVDIAIWGKAKCEPDGQPWKYDTTIWGGPAFFGTAVGFLWTAYTSWDAFFRNATGVHVQGAASGAGFLQLNWFNESGLPVGQFNAVSGGIGLVEAGGSGRWQSK